MLYLVREYLGGGCSLLDSKEKADNFIKKFNDYCFKEYGEGLNSQEYSLEEIIEINPSFNEWIAND